MHMANELKEKEIEVKRDERRIGHGECLSLLREIDSHKMYDRNRQTRLLKPLIDNLVLIRAAALDDCQVRKKNRILLYPRLA
jgi:hypothetical protein